MPDGREIYINFLDDPAYQDLQKRVSRSKLSPYRQSTIKPYSEARLATVPPWNEEEEGLDLSPSVADTGQ